MSDYSYFNDLEAAQKRLREHGFRGQPGNTEDILEYAFIVDAKLEALCRAIGFNVGQDHRGNWRANRTKKVM